MQWRPFIFGALLDATCCQQCPVGRWLASDELPIPGPDLCISRAGAPYSQSAFHCQKCSYRWEIHRLRLWLNSAHQCRRVCALIPEFVVSIEGCCINPILPGLSVLPNLFCVACFQLGAEPEIMFY